MKQTDLPLFRNPAARRLLDGKCKEHSITTNLLKCLVAIQRQYSGSGRPKGITEDFEACFSDFLDEEKE